MRNLAIVTGATGGIGRAVTARLWAEGYSLIALGKTWEKVLALKHAPFFETRQDGQHDSWLACDLGTDDLAHLVAHIDMFSGHTLTLLVVCHGAAPAPGPALDALADMQAVYETDVLGAFKVCQIAGRYMLSQRQGSIVFMSSLHARQTYPQRTAYCVAKSAVCGMARALAVEWGTYGVTVNAVLPWQVEGERSQRMIEAARARGEDLEEAWRQRSPQRRLIQPKEIADTVLWLARTPSVNGAEIVMDGGVSASMWYQGFTQSVGEQ